MSAVVSSVSVRLREADEKAAFEQQGAEKVPTAKEKLERAKLTDARFQEIYRIKDARRAQQEDTPGQIAVMFCMGKKAFTLGLSVDKESGCVVASMEQTSQLFETLFQQLQPGEMRQLKAQMSGRIEKRREELQLRKTPSQLLSLIAAKEGTLFAHCLVHLNVLDLINVSCSSKQAHQEVNGNHAVWKQLGIQSGFKANKFPVITDIFPRATRDFVTNRYKEKVFNTLSDSLEVFKFLYPMAKGKNLDEKLPATQQFLSFPQITFSSNVVKLVEEDLNRLPPRFVFHLPDNQSGLGLKYVNDDNEMQLELFIGYGSCFRKFAQLRNRSSILYGNNYSDSKVEKAFATFWNGTLGEEIEGGKRIQFMRSLD